MKYSHLIIVIIALVCLIQVASATPKMYIQPSSLMAANGSTFTVDVKVGPMGEEVTTAMYILQFDNTHLKVISQTQGGFLSMGGEETKVDKNDFDNTAGTVTYGEYIKATPDENHFGVYSPGTLASITFEAICDDGAGDLNITKPKLAVVIGRLDDPPNIKITYRDASSMNIYNGLYTVSAYPRGDLNHNWVAADAGDVTLMLRASVDDITTNLEYDLNNNGAEADAGDVTLMLRASVGDITL